MSAISDLYDALVTRLEAVLPYASGFTRIPNPYDLSDNNDQMLRQGWGLAVGPAANANRELSCNLHVDREFTVSISRELFKLEHDVEARADVDKQLMEDLRLVFKDFEKQTTLNTGLRFCTYVSDSGIESIRGESQVFLTIRAQFRTVYIENLNT